MFIAMVGHYENSVAGDSNSEIIFSIADVSDSRETVVESEAGPHSRQ